MPMSTSTATEKNLGPLQISEIILHTARYEEMKQWYQRFFGGLKPAVETDTKRQLKSCPLIERLCFLRIHAAFPFTPVLGIFEISGIRQPEKAAPMSTGLDHMQFREASLENLFCRYETLEDEGIKPFQSFNHGPGTSFYYMDPDGNTVELSASNFATEVEYFAFFQTEEYKSNIEGVAIDERPYIAKRRASMQTVA
jgi:catechol 2,3-dioxygenase-like lactoylglutathione lyase family enzyme